MALVSSCSQVVTLDAPEIGEVPQRPPAQSFVYDADGNQLAVLRKEFRERVSFDRIPGQLRDAVIVAEDQRFWVHSGVDARAIARAALRNVAEGEVEQGGSTITQQLVKILYMPDASRDFKTKAREALLARDLEEERTKEEILEEYLNTVYFGNGAYGVQAAAFTYWRKDVSELTLAESALLAAVIRAPHTLDPADSPQAAWDRRDAVLEAMAGQGLATHEEVDAALATPVDVQPRPPSPETTQPYWVDFVSRTLLRDPSFGADEAARAQRLYGGGLRIHTTLDPELQAAAEAAALRFFDGADDPEVAIVAVEPDTGAIRASVGGRDHAVRQFDLATQGTRQPGSTFKTFVLAAALASGRYRPDTPVNGNQGTFRISSGSSAQDLWQVRNYDRASYGTISLAEATRASVNGAYARVALDLGVGRVIAAARALGITSPLNDDPAIALGGTSACCTPLEMAASYATLANLGHRVPASPIDRIEDADGTVVWRPDRTPTRVLDPGVAFLVTDLLRLVVEDGTGIHARLPGWEVAGKTGTVQDYSDAWFVGYTTELSASVWMGYPDTTARKLRGIRGERVVTGGTWPARIWREFMEEALAGRTPSGFVLPAEHTVTLEIDPATGLRAAPWCPGEERTMLRLLAPTETCPSPPPPPPPPPSAPASEAPPPCPSEGPPAAPSPNEPGCTPTPTESGSASTPPPDGSPSPSPSPTGTGGSTSPSPSPSPAPTPDGGGSPSG